MVILVGGGGPGFYVRHIHALLEMKRFSIYYCPIKLLLKARNLNSKCHVLDNCVFEFVFDNEESLKAQRLSNKEIIIELLM